MLQPHGVLEASLYVDDLDAARSFYEQVLGLEFHSMEAGRHVFFRCGSTMVLLFNPESTMEVDHDVPRHGCHGAGHLCLAVADNEIAAWRERLARHGVPIEQEVAWPQGGHSLYIRDPAGNSLELATPELWRTA